MGYILVDCEEVWTFEEVILRVRIASALVIGIPLRLGDNQKV